MDLKKFLLLLTICILNTFNTNAQIRIGLWEPAINLSTAQKVIFNNSKEKLNDIDDDENGIADDIFWRNIY
ncbi:MAG: hypothetical protein IPJ81_13915 [Chitinophagaceae bacterium]|nr:hypothetical protein [Chitinophagaceae bacterium]